MRHTTTLALALTFAFCPFAIIVGQIDGKTGDASSPTPISQANEAFKQMYWCYVGMKGSSELTEEEYDTYQKISRNEFFRLETQIAPDYPVFAELYDHMRLSLEGKPNSALLACRRLRDALKKYEEIDNLPLQERKAKKKSYKDHFGIDREFIVGFYQSETTKSLGFIEGEPCVKNPTQQPPPPPDPSKKQSPEAKQEEVPDKRKVFEEEDPIEKLEKLLSRGLVDSFIEISQLIKGDGRIIPGQDGVPYEVKFKNAKTKEVLYFAGGQYVIEDDSDKKPDDQSRWKAFDPAIRDFSELVVGILQEYGNSAYHVFVQGSADVVTFSPKSLHPLYDDPTFHTIPLLKVDEDKKGVKKETVKVGDTYTNPLLPQLRAAFVKDQLLFNHRLKARPDKVTIVEGSVKDYPDKEKRNCSIILYIDWDKAKRKKR